MRPHRHVCTNGKGTQVTTRREGTKIYYRLAGADVAQLLVRAVASTHLPDVEAAAAPTSAPTPNRSPGRS
jgi:hypothetical protein